VEISQNHCAIASQSTRNHHAITTQSLRNHSAITATQSLLKKRGEVMQRKRQKAHVLDELHTSSSEKIISPVITLPIGVLISSGVETPISAA
jgi:hypothetical protein